MHENVAAKLNSAASLVGGDIKMNAINDEEEKAAKAVTAAMKNGSLTDEQQSLVREQLKEVLGGGVYSGMSPGDGDITAGQYAKYVSIAEKFAPDAMPFGYSPGEDHYATAAAQAKENRWMR